MKKGKLCCRALYRYVCPLPLKAEISLFFIFYKQTLAGPCDQSNTITQFHKTCTTQCSYCHCKHPLVTWTWSSQSHAAASQTPKELWQIQQFCFVFGKKSKSNEKFRFPSLSETANSFFNAVAYSFQNIFVNILVYFDNVKG